MFLSRKESFSLCLTRFSHPWRTNLRDRGLSESEESSQEASAAVPVKLDGGLD